MLNIDIILFGINIYHLISMTSEVGFHMKMGQRRKLCCNLPLESKNTFSRFLIITDNIHWILTIPGPI